MAMPLRAEDGRFDVLEYAVEGNTVLPAMQIETAVYPFLGEAKSIQDVEAARAALEKTYHDSGYLTVLVNIPEQKVDGGLVTLKVVEGSVGRLRVAGSRYYSLGEIKSQVAELKEGKVPHFPTVQKELAALNSSADRRVTPVLRSGRTPGQVEVDLKVEDQFPLHGDLYLDNRYSANTTEMRLSGNLRYTNLWQKQHSLGLGFQVAPENTDDARILSATYLMPAGDGRMLALYGVASRSDVGVAGDTRVQGNANILGLRWVQPLRSLGGVYHYLSMGADYKDFREDLIFGSDSINTPISYLPFNLEYRGQRAGPSGKSSWNLGATFSVRGLADETIQCAPGFRTNEFDCKRLGASESFFYLRGGWSHEHAMADGYGWKARMDFQLTDQPLISNEQYAAGGAQSVRGYTEAAALGDMGVTAGLEVSAPAWPKDTKFRLVPLAFVEGAQMKVVSPSAGQRDSFTLSSAGLGIRLASSQGVSSDLDVAWPLQDLGEAREGELRLHWRLGYQW